MHHGMTFNFGPAKLCSPAISETCYSYDKDIWIAAPDNYFYFYIIMLFLLTATLQFGPFLTDTALKVSRSLYCFTTSISHGVENYLPRLWGTGISDAIL